MFTLPESESRRVYFKELTSLLVQKGLSNSSARASAKAIIELLQSKIFEGDEVDLGFMKIVRRHKKPAEFKYNVGKKTGADVRTFCIGEHSIWTVRVHKSWQKKHRPGWSRF